MGRPRILVAEDNPEMREKIKSLLSKDFDIAGSVGDGQLAIDAVLKLSPSILVTDISMPIFNGLQVASRLRRVGCLTKLIFVTVHDDEDYLEAAFSLGALGYVLKSKIDTDLIPAVLAALQSRKFVSRFPVRQV